MDLKQMRYLIAVAEYRSFTLAAKALYISQPSLSAFVQKHEAELGVTLFDRSATPVSLTYAGEIYIEGLKKLCEEHDRLNRQMSDISGNKVGLIKAGFPTERASSMLPYILPAFKASHPGVKIQVTNGSSSRLLELVTEDRLDIAVVPTPRSAEKLVRHEICEEELFLVDGGGFVQKKHLVEGMADCVDIARLAGLPLVTLDVTHGIRMFQDKLFERHGVTPKIAEETSSNSAAYRLASAGLGVAIVPEMTIQMIREVAPVKRYRLSVTGTKWIVMAVTRKERFMSQNEKDFIQCMRKVYSKGRY